MVLDFILDPLLNLHPTTALIVLSIFISVMITVIYKFATKQDLMKELKDEMKALQKQMRELKAHPEEAMKINKKIMKANMQYMKHSYKSMFYTMIPILIIFGWMQANLAYEPILPDQQFQVEVFMEKGATGEVRAVAPNGILIIGDTIQSIEDRKVIFNFKGEEGEYVEGQSLQFEHNDLTQFKDVIITNEFRYVPTAKSKKTMLSFGNNYLSDASSINKIETKHESKRYIFGLTWLWTYIIISIIASIVVRKLMKVY